MAKSDPIGIRFDPAVRVALEKAAKADDRNLSSMINKLVSEGLRAGGWLKDQPNG